MAHVPGSSEVYYVGTMEGWYLESDPSEMTVIAHWVAFVVLLGTTVYLARESWTNKGPSKKSKFYAGYQEEQNIALLVNFFAMLSYYGKVVADMLHQNFHDVGPFILGFGNYRYADYMLTCPMLVYDLLLQLRAPYRISLSVVIFAILLSGVLAELYSFGDPRLQPGAYAWYGFGLFWFAVAYAVVMTIVAKQYTRLAALAHDIGSHHSLTALKYALITFSLVWALFPLVWALGPRGLGWIDEEVAEVVHCFCDIMAKSFYGWALARFRRVYDEELYQLLARLGHDEEEFERVEKDIRLSSSGERIRRLSVESFELRSEDSQAHTNVRSPRETKRKSASQRGGGAGGGGSGGRGAGGMPMRQKRSSVRSARSVRSSTPAPDSPPPVTAVSPAPRPLLAANPAPLGMDPEVEAGANTSVEANFVLADMSTPRGVVQAFRAEAEGAQPAVTVLGGDTGRVVASAEEDTRHCDDAVTRVERGSEGLGQEQEYDKSAGGRTEIGEVDEADAGPGVRFA